MFWLLLLVLAQASLFSQPEFLEESKSLLQHTVQRERPGTALLKAKAPFKFMHTPKCGSSFSNVIAHTPGVCPGLPNTVEVNQVNFGTYFDVEFWTLCPEICDSKMLTCNPKFWKHEIFGKHLIDPYRGHLVTMVRQPEQRIASDYYDAFFDFRGDVSYPGTRYRRKDALGNPVPHNISFEQFAPAFSGMLTTQLTRTDWFAWKAEIYLTDKDVKEAIRRLREDFAFVGIVDQWRLSMCLWHTMFGGDCLTSDFLDERPGFHGRSASDKYDTKGYIDPWDHEVWLATLELFNERLKEFDVSEETCRACYRQANLSGY